MQAGRDLKCKQARRSAAHTHPRGTTGSVVSGCVTFVSTVCTLGTEVLSNHSVSPRVAGSPRWEKGGRQTEFYLAPNFLPDVKSSSPIARRSTRVKGKKKREMRGVEENVGNKCKQISVASSQDPRARQFCRATRRLGIKKTSRANKSPGLLPRGTLLFQDKSRVKHIVAKRRSEISGDAYGDHCRLGRR